MRRIAQVVSMLVGCGLAPACLAQGGAPVQDESLAYTINVPGGLSLGEARVISHQASGKWFFEMVLDAGVPGFAISDHFRSATNSDLCSVEFERETLHGKRRGHEKTTFDYTRGIAQRVTVNGGGKSSTRVAGCTRDALAYIVYARRELGQGKVPTGAQVLFGASYRVKVDFIGPQTVTCNRKSVRADKVAVSVKGPASDFSFEIYFALDPARTPMVVKVPFSIGQVSMELVR